MLLLWVILGSFSVCIVGEVSVGIDVGWRGWVLPAGFDMLIDHSWWRDSA